MPVAGIDLGATNCRALVTDSDGAELGRHRRSTPAADGDAIATAVVETLRAACVEAGVAPDALAAVGVGSIGPLDVDAGAVVNPPNVPADRIPLCERVASLVDVPVYLHNDAVAGVIGERVFADAPENTVYLTLSSGVGAGAVVDGHVLSGHRGNAAEVGHFVLAPDGRPCGCGGTGHWEAYCGGEQIPDYARDVCEREGLATDLPLESDAFDATDVFEAVGSDPLADRVVGLLTDWNARGVASLVHAFAPEVVSVGGAVALENHDRVLTPVRERLSDLLAVPVPEVRETPLGHDAVLRGAVASALTGGTGEQTSV